MKQTFYAAALGLLGLALTARSAQAQKRSCATVDVLQQQLAADPGLAARMAAINNQAMLYAAKQAGTAQRGTVAVSVTIPVVVHVLYSATSENISDAQIQSQIDVLNEDYHKLNPDYTNTPSAFAGLVADVGVQFVLAKRTPTGVATTGIERKSSTTTSWGTADKIKQASTGGLDAWNASQYLNLWVGTIGGGILGYAQFPGGAAATDGVVISPVYFGRTGTVTSPYNLGRTASHEVGHWLNLNHIWGDDNGACTGTDNVADTPNQGAEHYGKPTFPQVSCSNGPNGDMFMNYMDYVDDNAMFMFSTGQSQRMNALFASGGARVGLLTSQGGVAPSGGSTTPPPTTIAYCASKGTSVAYEYISLVQLGSINRTSGADGGYYNGTTLSTSVAAGSSQTISYQTGFTGSGYAEYFRIYADWNQNGTFDAGETLVSSTNTAVVTGVRSATFTVPTTAKSGNTRLRVVMSDNSATTSCGSYSYGETEDYTISITGGARIGSSVARTSNPNALADQYTLYPNPATQVLNIARPANADPEATFSVRVYDLRGAEVRGLVLADGQVDVSGLRAGIYLLNVTDGTGTSHQRFVKE